MGGVSSSVEIIRKDFVCISHFKCDQWLALSVHSLHHSFL